jgi:UDP-N-acetylmuramoyl-L-alanyl-D-glutamate--2,6-diaminopimelate ligase
MSQLLTDLFNAIPVKILTPQQVPEIWVTGIAFDSRRVMPGDVFVVQVGGHVDAHRFIPMAVEQGAVAVVGTQPPGNLGVPYIQVEETHSTLAYLSAAFYNFPARKLTVIGVTGTDGKTTTCNLIYQILLQTGFRTGIISTVNAVIGDEVIDTGFHVTTPEAPEVQRYLARMVAAGLTHVVLETTSHGLVQHRVTGCEYDIGVLTNITHEHLDYHGSYTEYREAKSRLFTGLAGTVEKTTGNPRLAVLNRDDSSYEYLAGVTPVQQVSYSLVSTGADLRVQHKKYSSRGMTFDIVGRDLLIPIETAMYGDFNISNCLAAAAAALFGLGISPGCVQKGILCTPGVPGRMERIEMGQDFTALVDFAHTPNALKVALETVRQMTGKRVIAVFGSAGLRDRLKRRMMAEVACELADISIFTAEDPRTESLEGILGEMAGAALQRGFVEGQNFWRVPDRREALRLAVGMAKVGDCVSAFGKGHEQSMCFGEVEYPWDDRIAMRAALAESLGVKGPEMPFLPQPGSIPQP